MALAAVSSPEPLSLFARPGSHPTLLCFSGNTAILLPPFVFANTPYIESNFTLAGIDSVEHRFQKDIRPKFCQGITKPRIALVSKSWSHWLRGPVPIQAHQSALADSEGDGGTLAFSLFPRG